MPKKRGLPEDLSTLLRQLIVQRHIRMAGTVLYVFFLRSWKLDEGLAAYYVQRYFQKYYPQQTAKYSQQQPC